MKINGIVDLAKGPRIQVKVSIPNLGVSDNFWFLVDTGATYTQVSESDFLKLGVSREMFRETEETIFTAGNVLKQYVYPTKVRLTFGGKNYDLEPMRALLFQGEKPEQRKLFLENVLSILGRDYILAYKVTIRRNHIMFER